LGLDLGVNLKLNLKSNLKQMLREIRDGTSARHLISPAEGNGILARVNVLRCVEDRSKNPDIATGAISGSSSLRPEQAESKSISRVRRDGSVIEETNELMPAFAKLQCMIRVSSPTWQWWGKAYPDGTFKICGMLENMECKSSVIEKHVLSCSHATYVDGSTNPC
ncbi:hypothetical protein BD779DRAFT_1542518, partial [Infundibulicybe gibba]